MPEESSVTQTERTISMIFSLLGSFLKKKGKQTLGIILLLVFLSGSFAFYRWKFSPPPLSPSAVDHVVDIGTSYSFPALDADGKVTKDTIVFTVSSVEKTNRVLVKDQTFTAKNDKLFLIVNLEYKNETTKPLNIFPSDLIRLAYREDDARFAADLHNTLVSVASLSTKLDRLGFVIPQDVSHATLFIGELDKEKEDVSIEFPS